MEDIKNVSFGPLPENASGLKPLRMYFIQNGAERNWDLIKVANSVAVIIYNKTTKKLVFVRDFRPSKTTLLFTVV